MSERKNIFLNRRALTLILLVALTFLSYVPSLKNNFVNWDDDGHLLENRSAQSLSLENVKHIFTSAINRTYIPLTILSFAVEYHFAGYQPFL